MKGAAASPGQVNAYQWQRQGFDLGRRWTEEAALAVQPGLYAAGATPYLSLLARYAGFRTQDLDEALYQDRHLIRIQAMRRSVFLVPRPSLAVVLRATGEVKARALDRFLRQAGVSPQAYREVAGRIEGLLEKQCLTSAAIKKSLSPLSPQVLEGFAWILSRMTAEGRIVRGPRRGGWKSTLFEYTSMANWLPELDLAALDPETARVELARLYFGAYGPATAADFIWWSGLSRPEVERALAGLGPALVPLEVRDLPGEYLLPVEELERLRRTPAEPMSGVCLLPVWDAYLMAYLQRSRYLDTAWYDRVYDASGNGTMTVMAGGRVSGVWDMEAEGKRLTVKVAPFAPVGQEIWSMLRVAAQRLADRVPGESGDLCLLRCPPPPPLAKGNWNQFRFPLRGVEGCRPPPG
jgi:hypothetical protein